MGLVDKMMGAALVAGATMRLTRLVVVDDIGQWWVKDPIDKAMDRYAANAHSTPGAGVEEPWWWKYRSGLDCQWCVGFWIGAGVYAATQITDGTRLERPWKSAMTVLALNVATNALADKIGTYGWIDGEDVNHD